MDKLLYKMQRHFSPHHILLGAARHSLNGCKDKTLGCSYNRLMAITFSAIAVEAMANSFGDRFIDDWASHEYDTTVEKVKLLNSHLKVTADFQKEPWAAVSWLARYRNDVVHAKPEFLESEHIIPEFVYEKKKRTHSLADIEKQATYGNAARCVGSVGDLLYIWCDHIDPYEWEGLFSDGWSGSTETINESSESGSEGH